MNRNHCMIKNNISPKGSPRLNMLLIMKLVIVVLLLSLFSTSVYAKDMRRQHLSLAQQKARLKAEAQKELEAARQEALKQAQIIKNDAGALRAAVEKLTKENQAFIRENASMEGEIETLKEEDAALSGELTESRAVNRELAGFIRSSAKDLEAMLIQSIQSGLYHGRAIGEEPHGGDLDDKLSAREKLSREEMDQDEQHPPLLRQQERHGFLKPMIKQDSFPSMADIRKMAAVILQEIRASGEVNLTRGVIVDRQGVEQEADLLILGNFTAIYSLGTDLWSGAATADVAGEGQTNVAGNAQIDNGNVAGNDPAVKQEMGFLLYSEQSQRFFALSRLPERRIRKNLESYIKGEQEDVYMDISKGAALRQLAHRLSLWEQIPKGGPIVWPIVGILGFALLILMERILFFLRKRINADAFMHSLEPLIRRNRWEECRSLLEKRKGRLIPKVLLTALEFREQERTDMENALQEAILNEIPRIERFLSTLGMLAAIAPLLGLLGTVTGMINTFHVITYYGTGDPRMMSNGISEALVTTMLGLSVAIPVMLFHTLLSRSVETQIGKMEEKAVSFVNMVFKHRNGSGKSENVVQESLLNP